MINSAASVETWSICQPFEQRYTCIVDGDTIWYRGEKMRLLDVDTPELQGKCSNERRLASEATLYLQSILASGLVSIARHGQDRFGRSLVRLKTNSGDAGTLLINSGLADKFGDGIRPSWCR